MTAAVICRGFTTEGARCTRRTGNVNGWCGVCAGVAPAHTPAAAVSVPSAGPDPLAGVPPEWRPDDKFGAVPHNAPPELKAAISGHPAVSWVISELYAAAEGDHDYEAIGRLLERAGFRWEHERCWTNDIGSVVCEGCGQTVFQIADPDGHDQDDGEDGEWDKWAGQRAAVVAAARSDCPPGLLARIAVTRKDGYDRRVTTTAARNPSMPAAAFTELARDPDEHVRATAAANPAAPSEALVTFAADPHPSVRLAAARHPDISPAALAALATDGDPSVRLAAARRPEAPPATLAALAVDPDPDVRAAAAANPSCPGHGKAAAGLLNS